MRSREPRVCGALSLSGHADAVERPVGEEDLADDGLARHEAPDARVARMRAVVPLHQVHAAGDTAERSGRRNVEHGLRVGVAPAQWDVRLVQAAAVDVREPVTLQPDLPGQSDDALDEDSARALRTRRLRGTEDDDLASARIAEVVDEAVGQDAVPVRQVREEPFDRAGHGARYATAGASSRPISATVSRSS